MKLGHKTVKTNQDGRVVLIIQYSVHNNGILCSHAQTTSVVRPFLCTNIRRSDISVNGAENVDLCVWIKFWKVFYVVVSINRVWELIPIITSYHVHIFIQLNSVYERFATARHRTIYRKFWRMCPSHCYGGFGFHAKNLVFLGFMLYPWTEFTIHLAR